MNSSLYTKRILARSKIRFILGLLPRSFVFFKNSIIVAIAKRKGAKIGKNVILPYSLAKRANSNLYIGDSSTIQSSRIDIRSKVKIGSHVIIGADVEILTCSHNIDSKEFEFKSYGIEIDDYSWLATRVFVLPSCRKIGTGAVCGAGSVVIKNVNRMSVVSGNPAEHIRDRKYIHNNLCIESLLGNDLLQYIGTFTKNRK